MTQQKNPNPVQTIEITNFSGRLTRILNGDMNSGFAKFATSWGYDPFSKPMNLTWFEAPVDITGPITDTVVAAKKYWGGNGIANTVFNNVQQYILLLGNSGNLYLMQPNQNANEVTGSIVANLDSVLGSASVSGTFSYGGSLEIFNQPSIAGISDTRAVYIGSDAQISTVPLASLLGAQRMVTGTGTYSGTISGGGGAFRPMKIFTGLLRFSNAQTIATINGTGQIVSVYNASIRGNTNAASDLQTPLPSNSQIQDIDVSVDGNYLLIATSEVDNEKIAAIGNDYLNAAANDSTLYGWNGTDPNITTQTTMPAVSLTALQTYLGNNLFFSEDGFGSSVTDGINKLLTLPGNKSPFANATGVNGNFNHWVSIENSLSSNSTFATLYYFGGLDQENPPGLYRMCRISSSSAFVYNAPVNVVVDNYYQSIPSSVLGGTTTKTFGYGKHYISYIAPGFNGGANINKLFRFLVNSTGAGTPQFGIYETQTQLFSKKITVKQIRVYTEPTASGNGFQINFVGSDGNVITNGQFTYTYASGTDVTQAQGSLERIDFNPSMKDTYALGMRLTNTGSVNMTIKKVEIDWCYSGK